MYISRHWLALFRIILSEKFAGGIVEMILSEPKRAEKQITVGCCTSDHDFI